jgi:hypothetical protein
MKSAIRPFLSLLISGCLLFLTATPPSIGVVRSNGEFQVDGSTVRGNATVFEGSTVQTTGARSKIRLSDGAEIVLAPGSRVQLYRDRTVLQQGAQQVNNSQKHPIEAASLRISPADSRTVAEIVANDSTHVSVAAQEGSVDVRNSAGVLIASVRPGLALAFDMQAAGAATASKMSGCLVKKGNKYLLTDQTANVTVELQGPDLAKSAGHQVEITGSMIPNATPATGASQVIQVVTVDSVGAACSGGKALAAAAAGGAAAGGAAAGAAAGLSTGAIVAIVGGVAVAGTVGGLAAAGTFSGNAAAPASRP